MLISQEYVKQNAQLHKDDPAYGSGSHRHGNKIRSMMKEFGCNDLLDYGCGKGTLLQEIPGARGYDPALPEYSAQPEPADMVTCTDVMEHIEPECLDDVLHNINSLTRKLAAFVVACRPANKTLPDGRNTHLIVQSHEWWLDKLSEYFEPQGWNVRPGEFVFIGSPRPERVDVKKTESVFSEHGTPAFAKKHSLFIPTAIGQQQIEHSCARGLQEIEIQDTNTRTMALCAYGPSLLTYLEDLRNETADVVTTSGAHDVLIENGIIPHSHMEADAHKHKATFMSKAQKGIHYYLASRCHADCFDNVLAVTDDVKIWHLNHAPEENAEVKKVYPNATFIGGSASIASRAFCLGMVLGYRNFTIYAMDCSFPWDESLPFHEQRQHAGRHPNPQDVFRMDPIDGKVFYSTLQLITTANEFIRVLKRAMICNVTIRGTGLLAVKAKQLGLDRIRTPDL